MPSSSVLRRRPKVPTPVAARKVDLAHPGVALVGRSKACRRRTRYQRACMQSVRRFLHAAMECPCHGARDARGRCAWLQPAAHATCLRSKATQHKRAVGVVPGAGDGRRRNGRGAPMILLAARRVCGALGNPASLTARCQRPPSCGQGAPQEVAKEGPEMKRNSRVAQCRVAQYRTYIIFILRIINKCASNLEVIRCSHTDTRVLCSR